MLLTDAASIVHTLKFGALVGTGSSPILRVAVAYAGSCVLALLLYTEEVLLAEGVVWILTSTGLTLLGTISWL